MAVISIQSRVSYGSVGNSAAVFPLQRLGFDVWEIDTVELSNHTGYGAWKGSVLGADHVRAIAEGLRERGVLPRCEAVLSGYLGEAAVADAVLETLGLAREANPEVLYCCDPVMGDSGKGFFVKKGIPELIKARALPSANIITPNLFELQQLSEITVASLADAERACRKLHGVGPSIILVTSLEGDGNIVMAVSEEGRFHRTETPILPFPLPPSGAGDLTAAIFLARYLESKDARYALELTTDSVFGILEHTLQRGAPELAIVEAQDLIVAPKRRFRAHSS